MELSKLSKKVSEFFIKRIIEIFALLIITFSIFLFTSMLTHSPDDPNFIFSAKTQIKNAFGIYGSYTSDFFLQAFGLISFFF